MKEIIKLYGSRKEMCERLNISYVTSYNWEKNPSAALKRIQDISTHTGKPVSELVAIIMQ
jgi:hypothetical protein